MSKVFTRLRRAVRINNKYISRVKVTNSSINTLTDFCISLKQKNWSFIFLRVFDISILLFSPPAPNTKQQRNLMMKLSAEENFRVLSHWMQLNSAFIHLSTIVYTFVLSIVLYIRTSLVVTITTRISFIRSQDSSPNLCHLRNMIKQSSFAKYFYFCYSWALQVTSNSKQMP